MWIRSQSKDALTNVHHLKILYLHHFGYCIVTDNHVEPNTTTNLGVYSTKEKAKKVLDTIHFYLNNKYTETTINDHEQYIMEQRHFNVFQMPQDDEVEDYAKKED